MNPTSSYNIHGNRSDVSTATLKYCEINLCTIHLKFVAEVPLHTIFGARIPPPNISDRLKALGLSSCSLFRSGGLGMARLVFQVVNRSGRPPFPDAATPEQFF